MEKMLVFYNDATTKIGDGQVIDMRDYR